MGQPARDPDAGPLRIDVVYAANLQIGDRLAGSVKPDAPTRPAQPYAAAWLLTEIRIDDGPDGKQVTPVSYGTALTPFGIADQAIVIRGLASVRPRQSEAAPIASSRP